MNGISPWVPGDVIVFRGISQKKIWYALPVFIVQDTPVLIALFWPAGTKGKWRWKSSEGRITPLDVLQTPLEISDRIWNKTDVLMLITPGAAHAVYVMWEEGQKDILCWYVNLQDPICRTAIGFDTRDQWLDIVVSPDKSSWQWKDEDELDEAVALGLFSKEEAQLIRAEGERVIRLICENKAPFGDGWEKWSPPTNWNIPKLSEEWDIGFS
jgi:hypothetical protein